MVSGLASSHGIRVLLTGEGSDEFFIGYPQIVLEPLLSTSSGTMSAVPPYGFA